MDLFCLSNKKYIRKYFILVLCVDLSYDYGFGWATEFFFLEFHLESSILTFGNGCSNVLKLLGHIYKLMYLLAGNKMSHTFWLQFTNFVRGENCK